MPVQPAQVPAHRAAKTWARFTAKIVPTPGCHYWVGAPTDDGYRRFTANSLTVRACRFLWTAQHGPLPPAGGGDAPDLRRTQLHPTGPPARPGSQAENLASAAGQDHSAGCGGTPGRADRRGMAGRSRAGRSALVVLILLALAGLLGSNEVAENIVPTTFWLLVWIAVPLSVRAVR